MNFRGICFLALVVAMLPGCTKEKTPAAISEVEVEPAIPTHAQPKLPTVKLWIGAEEMTAEMAVTAIQMQTGMMFRTNIAENEGMIFVLPFPQRASFWMKNTSVPLSAAYIDAEGVIQEIHNLEPHNTNAVKAASENIQYVLETSQGWFQRHNIGAGTLVRTERGNLRQTFFRQ